MDITVIFSIFGPLVLGAIGYMAKKFFSKIEVMQTALDLKPAESEVRQLIEDKNAVIYSKIDDLKDDICNITKKLDKILLEYAARVYSPHKEC